MRDIKYVGIAIRSALQRAGVKTLRRGGSFMPAAGLPPGGLGAKLQDSVRREIVLHPGIFSRMCVAMSPARVMAEER